MRHLFIHLTRNPISMAGATITTVSVVLIASLFAFELIGFIGNPYVGIIAYLILPGFFVIGLLLIPIGIRRQRKIEEARLKSGEEPANFPVIDLNNDRTRRLILTFISLSVVNVVIVATVMFKAVEVMETDEFCGETCHTVMQPERTAHMDSPHARVNCVDCHIGSGADWFVKSKLSGAWQVVSVAMDLYPRPIPSPVHDLRPARETCEECHWSTKFVGNRPKVITKHEDDEANTALKTVLMLKVGGQEHGIHWHVNPGVEIRYRSDRSRETVYEIELTRADGSTTHFNGPESAPEGETGEWRTMDCVDCHNRPTHVYARPDEAVDEAIVDERIAADLPYVRREGVRLIQQSFDSHDAARSAIAEGLRAFYTEQHPDVAAERGAEIESAGRTLGDLYARNVFPDMRVDWNTYPNHIGHEYSTGCFRCHTDEHTSESGDTISQDCEICHNVLAWDEEDPEILRMVQQ